MKAAAPLIKPFHPDVVMRQRKWSTQPDDVQSKETTNYIVANYE